MKQLEKAGIPATHICTVTPISKTVGAARIFGAQAIPYPTGDPNLPPEKEMNRRREIVMGALNLLTEGGALVAYAFLTKKDCWRILMAMWRSMR